MATQLMRQTFLITPDRALIQSMAILPDDEYGTFTNGQTLNRDQILLAMIRTRHECFRHQKRKVATRRDAGNTLIASAGHEKVGGKRNNPSDSRARGRGREREKEKGLGNEDRDKESDNDRIKTGSKRCGDSGHKRVKCPDQVCGVCGGKGQATKICDNTVSVFACQDTDDKMILTVEEEED